MGRGHRICFALVHGFLGGQRPRGSLNGTDLILVYGRCIGQSALDLARADLRARMGSRGGIETRRDDDARTPSGRAVVSLGPCQRPDLPRARPETNRTYVENVNDRPGGSLIRRRRHLESRKERVGRLKSWLEIVNSTEMGRKEREEYVKYAQNKIINETITNLQIINKTRDQLAATVTRPVATVRSRS